MKRIKTWNLWRIKLTSKSMGTYSNVRTLFAFKTFGGIQMGPEFNEKMQWARYLQMQHDEERRKEKARMERIEEELKKEEENKDIEEKYMNYEFEEKTEEKAKESKDDKSLGFIGEIFGAALSLLFVGGILGTLFWILWCLVSEG